MTEKTEWEVVDDAARVDDAPRTARPSSLRQLMKALLGPWWRWKVAAFAVVASLVLIFFATIAGVVLLSLCAIGLLSIGISKVRQWLRAARGAGSALDGRQQNRGVKAEFGDFAAASRESYKK